MENIIFYWGQSKRMESIQRDAQFVAKTNAPVLITGPSGCGKDMIAKYIHFLSEVKGDYVAINCAAIPENLLESLLFGHERGVFTGAFDRQIGLFERAAGGTLFLDEIGCMPELLQAKLLRVLQDMEFQRLGGHQKIKLTARLLTATNENLEKAIVDGRFREDLFYRINVFPIVIPSLKSRLEDVPALLNYFVELMSEKYHYTNVKIDRGLSAELKSYDWPGNIRELKNAVEYAVLKSHGEELLLSHFPERIQSALNRDPKNEAALTAVEHVSPGMLKRGFEIPQGGIRALIKSFEKAVIIDVLRRHGGILNRAYKELGIPKPTLIQRTRQLNIDVHQIKYDATR